MDTQGCGAYWGMAHIWGPALIGGDAVYDLVQVLAVMQHFFLAPSEYLWCHLGSYYGIRVILLVVCYFWGYTDLEVQFGRFSLALAGLSFSWGG